MTRILIVFAFIIRLLTTKHYDSGDFDSNMVDAHVQQSYENEGEVVVSVNETVKNVNKMQIELQRGGLIIDTEPSWGQFVTIDLDE